MAGFFLSFFRISVIVGVIAGVLLLLGRFLDKRYAAKWKCWVWVLLALWLLVPFGGAEGRLGEGAFGPVQALGSLKPEENGTENPAAQGGLSPRIVIELPPQMTVPISEQFPDSGIGLTLLDIAALVWAFGGLAFLSVHLIGYFCFKSRIKKRAAAIRDDRILSRISEIKGELRIRRAIYAVSLPEADSPMITGFLKPVLILPESQYSSGELFFILKHELVHWKRGDLYKKLLFIAANAVHWFNPLIWLMRREAGVDMELSCDERVTQGADYAVRKAYTETLMSMLQRRRVAKTALSTQFYGGKKIMKKRFENILCRAHKKNGAVVLAGVAVLAASLGMLVGYSAVNAKADSAGQPNAVQPAGALPQNGQLHGYISGFDKVSVAIDRQLWVTSEDEGWKPEYNEAAGFEVVDAEGEDIRYPLSGDCTYSVLENHHDPAVALDGEEFQEYLSEMEFPVLWLVTLEDGRITDIREQYVP